MNEVIRDVPRHMGMSIMEVVKNFRHECIENGVEYKKEEFLLGIIMGMKVFVTLEYRDGQEIKVMGLNE